MMNSTGLWQPTNISSSAILTMTFMVLSEIYKSTEWLGVKPGTDIHISLRMNWSNSGDVLNLLFLTSVQHFFSKNMLQNLS